MTMWEFAVARAYAQLLEASKARQLTAAESVSMDRLRACVGRYEAKEAA